MRVLSPARRGHSLRGSIPLPLDLGRQMLNCHKQYPMALFCGLASLKPLRQSKLTRFEDRKPKPTPIPVAVIILPLVQSQAFLGACPWLFPGLD